MRLTVWQVEALTMEAFEGGSRWRIRGSRARMGHRICRALCSALWLLWPADPAAAEESLRRAADDEPYVEEVTVVAEPRSETDLVGANMQPEWTTRQRFGESDVYVQPPWQIELSAGWTVREPNDDGDTRYRFLQEIEIGLPYRLQADLELTEQLEGGDGEFSDVGIELRWALADWGRIFMNPTIYGEWEFHPSDADEFEITLLLGDSVTQRLFTAVNFFYEQQVGGDDEQEFAVSNAWSYSLIDRVLGVGTEMRLTLEKEKERKAGKKTEEEFEPLFSIGPSLSWRVTDSLNLIAAPLFGVTDESPTVESFLFLQYYFGGDDDEYVDVDEETPSMEAR